MNPAPPVSCFTLPEFKKTVHQAACRIQALALTAIKFLGVCFSKCGSILKEPLVTIYRSIFKNNSNESAPESVHRFFAGAHGAQADQYNANLDETIKRLTDDLMQTLGIPCNETDKKKWGAALKAFILKTTLLSATLIETQQANSAYRSAKEALSLDQPTEQRFDASIVRVCEEATRAILNAKKKEKILEARTAAALRNLSQQGLESLYLVCVKELKAISSFRSKFDRQVEGAKIPEPAKHFANYSISHSKNPARPLTISTTTICMGYSIFQLLLSKEILNGEYNGELSFSISLDHIEKLNDYLDELNLWFDDFTSILGELVETDFDRSQQYFHIARKPIAEIIKSPYKMSRHVQSLLRQDGSYVLLLNLIAINLNNHPEKFLLKTMIESYYREAELKSQNGANKTFLLDDPFVSNLSIDNLKAIIPFCNTQLVLKRKAFDFFSVNTWTGVLSSLPVCQLTEMSLLAQEKAPLLVELLQALRGNPVLVDQFLLEAERARSINQIRRKTLELEALLIRKFSGVNLRFRRPVYELTDADKAHLYRGSQQWIQTGSLRLKNVLQLFSILERSPLIINCTQRNPQFSESIAFLKAEFERRYREYPQLADRGFYGKEMVRTSIDYFETLVAKVHYANNFGFNETLVEQMLNALVAICNQDLRNCAEGFSGRIQDLILALDTSSTGNTLEGAICEALVLKGRENFGRLMAREAQSSHYVSQQTIALEYLGLHATHITPFDALLSKTYAKETLFMTLAQMTSYEIYKISFKWVADKFWNLNLESDHEEIYALFDEFGFGNDRAYLQQMFAVFGDQNRGWQSAFFKQALPPKLVNYLIKHHYLFTKEESDDILIGIDGRYVCIPRQYTLAANGHVNFEHETDHDLQRAVGLRLAAAPM